MPRRKSVLLIALATIAALIPATTAIAAGEGLTINEIRIDQPSTDTDEFFELSGEADASLDGLTYLVIGDGTGGSGVIEAVVDLDGIAIDADGLFLAAESSFTLGTPDLETSLDFENSDNVTHLLVTDFAGSNGDDLDTDDDGTLDTTPWATIVDSVALYVSDDSELYYSSTVVGPDGDFVPGHVFDCDDGWRIGDFGGADNTPGESNVCETEPEPEPTELFIHEVQGSGAATDYEGAPVIIEGVVVSDFNDLSDQLGGFNVQEERADRDDDPATSEGIFVFAPSADEVSIGDIVRVTGTATEFSDLTEITDVTSVEIVGSDEREVDAFRVSLPMDDWEPYEGMLVTFRHKLYISEYFNYDRFGEIVLTTRRQYQGTHAAHPGADANEVAAANARERVTLDDTLTSQNPETVIHPNGDPFTLDNTFRGGDTLRWLTGTVDYSFGAYKIQPVHLDDAGVRGPSVRYRNENRRPTRPDRIKGDVRVASFNVLNFFTHLDDGSNDFCGPTGNLECRGADTAEEYQRQLDKLVAGILALDADIVGIQEIENDILTTDGDRAHDAVLTLVETLNAAEGEEVWAWVGEANHYNDYPVRNEIIYQIGAMEPVGDPIADADAAFDDVRPGDIEPLGRPPLAQTFRQIVRRGEKPEFAVVVNHFKSKGSECDDIGDPDAGDGQGNCNLTRVAQSNALLDFVDEIEEGTTGVLVVGDLNSYRNEDPITTLEDAGLTDLVEKYEGKRAYSYVFDGQLGYLDTALATRSLRKDVKDTTVFHINADEPDILDYDTSFKSDTQIALYEPLPYRVSDHDPVIVGLTFEHRGHGWPDWFDHDWWSHFPWPFWGGE